MGKRTARKTGFLLAVVFLLAASVGGCGVDIEGKLPTESLQETAKVETLGSTESKVPETTVATETTVPETEKTLVFADVDETVYAAETVNIRKEADTGAKVAGKLRTGQSVKRGRV